MGSNAQAVPPDPTAEEAIVLFKAVEDAFPSKTLGEDKWYILVVSHELFGPTDQTE